MLIEYKELSAVRKTVEVEVPADDVSAAFEEIVTEFARQAKIPGFRAGKVPREVVRKRFHKDIQEEVTNRLLPRYFAEAVREKKIAPVGDPMLKRADELQPGTPFRFEAEFEIKPEFELKDYRGIEITPAPLEVDEKEVDETIDRIRDQAGTFRLIEDRPAAADDYVIFDLETSGEGMELRREERSHVRLGEETPLPEIHEALRGRRPGETASFDKSWGDDAANEALRGKNVHYQLEVREIRVRELPAIDDEFAKSLGFESVDGMRSRIGADVRSHKEHERTRGMRHQAADHLTLQYDFAVPEALVEEELGNSLRNYARYLASQGLDLERAEINWEKVREEFAPEAVRRVRRDLILEKIAIAEKLAVGEAEIDAEIRRAATDAKKEFAEVKHRLRHDGGYESLRQSLLRDRALDFVVDQAKIIA